MLRTLVAVVAGYVIMSLCVMVLFTAYYLLLGTGGTYQEGSYEVTAVWLAGSILFSLIAAFVGGYSSTAIGRGQAAPRILAGIVLVLGLAMAFMYDPEGMHTVRTGDVGVWDAAALSVEPKWLAFLNPFLGVVGVLIGAARAASGRSRTVQEAPASNVPAAETPAPESPAPGDVA